MNLLETTLKEITPQDKAWREKAKERLDRLAMPHWALGRLMDQAIDLAGITRSLNPAYANRTIAVMAGDHGIADENLSTHPKELTPVMVKGFLNGIAGINALANATGTDIVVVDVGVATDIDEAETSGKLLNKKVAYGTANMADGPAMTREQAIACLEAGIEVANELADSVDIFGTGEMGIANTSPSTAIVSVLTGADVRGLTGRGSGINDKQMDRKIELIERAIEINKPDPNDGLDVLMKIGGLEIGAIAGLILGSAALHKPVVVDGFISTAGALIAQSICPASSEYMIASHRSVEQGHPAMQKLLMKEPLLDLNLRLGEGTGAALAMPLIEASCRLMSEMSTIDEVLQALEVK